MQLIFCVESNKTNRSDWIYLKELMDHYYGVNPHEVKYSTVFLGGKTKYNDSTTRNQIAVFKKQYQATGKNRVSKVIYVMDTDDYDSNPADAQFYSRIREFCEANSFDLIWFCKDIERVFWDSKVADHEKKREAERFRKSGRISSIDEKQLNRVIETNGASNVLLVLDKYIARKA